MLESVVARIVRALDPEQVILFGSQAGGEPRPESDVDLLIVLDDARQKNEELRRARQLVAQCFPPVDVAICAPEDLVGEDRYFFQLAIERGVALYKRDNRDAAVVCDS